MVAKGASQIDKIEAGGFRFLRYGRIRMRTHRTVILTLGQKCLYISLLTMTISCSKTRYTGKRDQIVYTYISTNIFDFLKTSVHIKKLT